MFNIATGYELDGLGIQSRWGEIFRTCSDRPWGPPSLLYNGYRVFPGGKERSGRDSDPSPPSSAMLKKEWAVRPVQSLSVCTRVHFTRFSNKCWFFGILIRKSLIPHDDISEICFIKVLKSDDLQANTAILIKSEITTF